MTDPPSTLLTLYGPTLTFIGVIVAGYVTYLNQVRLDRERRNDETKRKVYADYLAAADRLIAASAHSIFNTLAGNHPQATLPQEVSAYADFRSARDLLTMYATETVFQLASAFEDAVAQKRNTSPLIAMGRPPEEGEHLLGRSEAAHKAAEDARRSLVLAMRADVNPAKRSSSRRSGGNV